MKPAIAIVADDLTGAADAGLGFRQAGHTTRVVQLESMFDSGVCVAAAVLAIDTGTRSASADEAAATTSGVVSLLRAEGVRLLYKKVDSTLRGHLAAELRAVLGAWHPGAVAVVAPAFPRTGRTMAEGILSVAGRRAEGPSLPQQLELGAVVARLAALSDIRSGFLPRILLEVCQAGSPHEALVCDAETDEDLQLIADAGMAVGPRAVWVGSGGLAAAVAARCPPSSSPVEEECSASRGPVLAVVGSRSPMAAQQVRDLEAAGVVLCHISPATIEPGSSAVAGSFANEVLAHLRETHDVAVVLSDAIAPRPTGGEERLMFSLGVLLRPAADLVGGLILTGGDTAAGVLQAWDIQAFDIIGEVEPGIPLSVTCPRQIPIVTKAGGFGRPGALTAARDRLRVIMGAARRP